MKKRQGKNEREGRGRGGKQAERMRVKRNRGRGKWGKEGERCEGKRENGRAREKGTGSGFPAAERTALKTPAGCGPPAAPPRVPNPGLRDRRPYLTVPRGPGRRGASPPAPFAGSQGRSPEPIRAGAAAPLQV